MLCTAHTRARNVVAGQPRHVSPKPVAASNWPADVIDLTGKCYGAVVAPPNSHAGKLRKGCWVRRRATGGRRADGQVLRDRGAGLT